MKERMLALLSRYRQSAVAKHIVSVLWGGIAAQAISLVVAPIYTRVFLPTDMGVSGLYFSIVSVLLVIACLRFDILVPAFTTDEDAYNDIFLCMLIVTGTATMFGAASVCMVKSICAELKSPELAQVTFLVPASMALGGMLTATSYWATRRGQYRRIAQANVWMSGASSFVTLAIGLIHRSGTALILGGIASQVVGLMIFTIPLRKFAQEQKLRFSWNGVQRVWKNNFRGAITYTGSQLLSIGSLMLPSVMLASAFGSATNGQYTLAVRVIGIPVTLIFTSLGQVMTGEAGRISRSNPAALSGFFGRMLGRSAQLSIFPILLGAVCPFLFGIVFGSQWRQAGTFALILSMSSAMQLMNTPVAPLLILIREFRAQLFLDVFRLFLVLPILWGVPRLGWAPVPTLVAFALAMCVVYASSIIVGTLLVRRYSQSCQE